MEKILNWKQELAQEVNAIEDLNRNSAILNFNIATNGYDPSTGLNTGSTVIQRKILIKAPHKIDARLVDGKNYLAGDLVCEIAFSELWSARTPLASDREIIVNGVQKSLDDVRPYHSGDCGIDIGIDTLCFGELEYDIANIEGLNWLNNEPAKYLITMRR